MSRFKLVADRINRLDMIFFHPVDLRNHTLNVDFKSIMYKKASFPISVYVCEIKYRKRIDSSIIKSIEEKIKKLTAPKNLSIRPVLIYAGELSDNVRTSGMFSQCISLEDLLY